MGFFLNMLAIRFQFSRENSPAALLSLVKDKVILATEHQDYGYDLLLESLQLPRDLQRNPLFEIGFDFQQFEQAQTTALAGLQFLDQDAAVEVPAKFDLSFLLQENANGISIAIDYNTSVYTNALINQLGQHYKKILEMLSSANLPIAQIQLLTRQEIAFQLHGFAAPHASAEAYHSLLEMFGQICTQYGNEAALYFEDKVYTYETIDCLSNQLAWHLIQDHGIVKGDLIMVALDRNDWAVISLLAVLKAGAAFLPVDPAYPMARKEFMQTDSNSVLSIDNGFLKSFFKLQDKYSIANPHISVLPSDLAYCLYTSGSTGNPKGVDVGHGAIANTIHAQIIAFHAQPGDAHLQFASLSFDASISEIFVALCSGGCLSIISDDRKKEVTSLQSFLSAQKIDIATLPPVLIPLLHMDSLTGLKTLVSAGESAPSEVLQQIATSVRCINAYGPTEAAICSTYHVVDPNRSYDRGIPIGKPILGVEILLLDDHGLMLPYGAIGEICIGGKGLSNGYRNLRELTKSKFISNPADVSKTLYRTGDLGRFNNHGELEFLGRKDDQVKVRGHRVELGEIEFQLNKVQGIDKALVICVSDNGTSSLIAYHTGHATEESIRMELDRLLPEHMHPQHFVQIPHFPMTINGKIDRKALPALNLNTAEKSDSDPETEDEKVLAACWAEILGIDASLVKRNADFFRMGGQSIKAIRLGNRIHEMTGIRLGISDIFAASKLQNMALKLRDKMEIQQGDIIPMAEKQDSYPLSLAQYRLWILSRIPESSRAYHLPSSLNVSGNLDVKQVELAWKMLLERHESLRTVFMENPDGEIRQCIVPVDEVASYMQYVDLSLAGNKEWLAKQLEKEFFNHDFDLSSGPLTKMLIVKIDEDCHVLHLLQHHIISDAWSMEVLVKDFFRFYEMSINGYQPANDSLPIQYKDFAVWSLNKSASSRWKEDKSYWLNRFQGDLPTFQLQSDIKRLRHKTYTGARITQNWIQDEWLSFKSWSSGNGATPFMGLLSLVSALMSRYTGEKDMIWGTPVAGRDHPLLKDQIGFYLGALPLRIQMKGNDEPVDLLSEVKKTVLEAFEHKDFTFDALVDALSLKRDNSRHPIFDLWFDYHEWNNENFALPGGLTWTAQSDLQHQVVAKFDCSFLFTETQDGLECQLEYNTSVYTQSQMKQLSGHLKCWLDVFMKGQSSLASMKLLGDDEVAALQSSFSAVQWKPVPHAHLISRFETSLSSMQNRRAVSFNNHFLSYRELNEKANQFAHYLVQSCETAQDDLIAIQLPRNENMIVAVLGILKAGAAFVPIDAQYPEVRKAEMLRQSQCRLVVDDECWENFILLRGSFSRQNLSLERSPKQLAYSIFTSGSSGVPKAVLIEHGSLMNYLDWAAYTYHQQEPDRVWLFSSLSFDFTITQLFLPLLLGKELVLADPEENLQQTLAQILGDNDSNVIKLTPSHLSLIDSAQLESAAPKVFVMGGEALTETHVELLRHNKGCRIYNEYGPTETTVGTVVMELSTESGQPLIGSPIWNTDLLVLDANGQLLPQGAAGELYIGGAGVARGYAHQPEATADKFVVHPFDPSRKIYKTGDLVRWTDNGLMQYLGRIDQQVKIRGYRIEPGEVESKMRSLPGLEEVAVLPRELPQGDLELISFYTGTISSQELAAEMNALLPTYMHPSAFIKMEEWPLTVNGKLDAKNLWNRLENMQHFSVMELPSTFQERKMADIWADVLGIDLSRIGLDTDFFELGGQSLKAIRLVNRLNKELDMQVSISDLFTLGSIRAICRKHPHGRFFKKEEALVRFHTPDFNSPKHLFYIPPILGVPVGPDQVMFGLKEYHTWGFIYTPEEDFIEYCTQKIIGITGEGAEIVLMGYSSGGNIAFEVVKKLTAAGCNVRKLILVDSSFKREIIEINEDYVDQEMQYWTLESDFTREFFSSDLNYYQNLIRSYASYMASIVNTGQIGCPIFHLRSESNQGTGFDNGWEKGTVDQYTEAIGLGSHEKLFFPEFAYGNNKILIEYFEN